MPTSEIARLRQVVNNSTKGVATIAGCVDYVAGGNHYRTGFLFEADRGTETTFKHLDPDGGNVPANEVVLLVNPGIPGINN